MTILFSIVLYGAFLSLLYGWGLEFAAIRVLRLDDGLDVHFSITILLGTALISGLLGIWSFYWGISTRALVVFTALGALILIAIRKYMLARVNMFWRQLKDLGPGSILVCGLFAVYALYLASAASPTFDTGLYHAQSIHWTEYYPVVPGLANLFGNLGYSSSIFLLAAFWGFVAFNLHAYQIPGLIIVFCLAAYCLSLIMQRRNSPGPGRIVALGILAYLLLQQRLLLWLASPTTDLPAAVISWTVFLLAIHKIEAGQRRVMDLHTVAIVALSLFDVSIKLTTAPILLVPIFLLWEARASFSLREVGVCAVLPMILFVPWIARNIVLTGYVIFPFDGIDIFSFDWKVPPETVRDIARGVEGWARIPYERADQVLALRFRQWFPQWFQTLSTADLLLFYGSLLGPLLLAIHLTVHKEVASRIKSLAPAYALALAGVALWFLEAPSTRFGYGFLAPVLVLGFAPVLDILFQAVKLSDEWFRLLAHSLLMVVMLAKLVQVPVKSWRHYQHSIRPYPVAETRSIGVDDQAILQPLYTNECWYALPCTPAISPGLSLRATNVGDGFYIREK